MVKYFVDHIEEIVPVKQIGESTYYPRRTIQDSRIDFEKVYQISLICLGL